MLFKLYSEDSAGLFLFGCLNISKYILFNAEFIFKIDLQKN